MKKRKRQPKADRLYRRALIRHWCYNHPFYTRKVLKEMQELGIYLIE